MQIIVHAPTVNALNRARSNARNLLLNPAISVKIILNADAVDAALSQPDLVDSHTWLCPNTLKKIDKTARPPLRVLEHGAIESIAQLQTEGWLYVRA